MPRVHRSSKRLTPEVEDTFRVLSPVLWEARYGGSTGGREAWEVLGPELTASDSFPPEVWWAYEPGVPADLRPQPELDPLRALTFEEHQVLDPARAELRERRQAWLDYR